MVLGPGKLKVHIQHAFFPTQPATRHSVATFKSHASTKITKTRFFPACGAFWGPCAGGRKTAFLGLPAPNCASRGGEKRGLASNAVCGVPGAPTPHL